jgi:hypothetical protein
MADLAMAAAVPPPAIAGRLGRWWLLALPGAALFVIAAVVLEVTGGANANSPVPSWAHLVPLGWPQWVRVVWWLSVAGAAAVFRVGLRRFGMPARRLGDVVAVAPFLAFAAGIALGADWATWH